MCDNCDSDKEFVQATNVQSNAGRIPSHMSELSYELGFLSEVLEELLDKLKPVLNDNSAPAAIDEKPQPLANTALGRLIQEQTDRVRQLRNYAHYACVQLEL